MKGKRSKQAKRERKEKKKQKKQEILTVEKRFDIRVLGFLRDSSIRIRDSEAKHGDHIFFMLPHGDTTVFRAFIGPKGNVVDVHGLVSGVVNVRSYLEMLGCPKVIPTETSGDIVGKGFRVSTSKSSSGPSKGKPSADLPSDIDELKALLQEAGKTKSEKSKIRAQLRKLGHAGGLKGKAK